jgi:predicted AAA+ superfamily ATPase
MDASELYKFNEWWDTGKVNENNLEKYKRYLFSRIQKFMDDKQIILITGLRRVGKTRLMYQIVNHLLEKGADKRKIFFFSFDEKGADLKDVLETYKREVLRKNFRDAGRVYMFLDEIQKVDDWENKIKVYYDLNPNIKFFLSGSASLILSRKSKESLAGRIYEFVLKPLTFKEFLDIKGVKISFSDAKLLNEKILPHFSDFLIKAGFPEIIQEENEEKIRSYIKLSVIDRIIYKDVPSQFGRTDVELLEKLVDIFLKNPGSVLNFDNLARDLGRDKKTIIKYVYYLRFSLLLNFVSNYRISILAASRKNKKIYPAASSLAFALYGNFYSQIMGSMMEAAFCHETDARYYFRKGKKEIDFLIMRKNKIIPVEIKSGDYQKELVGYASVMNGLDLKKGIMLTTDKFGEFSKNGIKILLYPLWVFVVFMEEILANLMEKGG